MITGELLSRHREAVLEIAQRYGLCDIRIFGTVARGEAGKDSDGDFIVKFEPGRSLFDQGGLLMDLQKLLGVRVDIISEDGIRPRWREYLNQEAVPL
jgi:predicted nucleotidyltransferase